MTVNQSIEPFLSAPQQAKSLWETVLGHLQIQVTRPSFQTWLKDTVGVAHLDGEFVVGTPSAFVAEMLERRMYSLISQAMAKVTSGDTVVRFQVQPTNGGPASPKLHAGRPQSNDPQTPLPPTNGHGGHASPTSNAASPVSRSFRRLPLNPRYTFETFVTGTSNELAHAAATAVCENPGTTYNPLVIYSEVGLGKTHLLHAIGHRLRAAGLMAPYTTTEEFTNEYIRAIRNNSTEEFRDRYRTADVLLLDDIQFLIGKEQTQEGFFHTFNALHMANKQIVITSDRPISALSLLEDRVKSRLSGGLVADVQSPDLETRLAILIAKAESTGCTLTPEVTHILAERFQNNVRELEGTLHRALAYARLDGGSLTLPLAQRAVRENTNGRGHSLVKDLHVLDAVASYFTVPSDDLTSTKRDRKTAHARQVAMYILREDVNLGPTAIRRVLHRKDHTTIIHGHKRIATLLQTDQSLQHDIATIRAAVATA